MGTQTDIKVGRRRRQIAASYRKQGYRVVVPSSPEKLPSFLRDCHPDLIAEKEGDRVVIEVKATRALKGASDLVELAERVDAQPGWRLELVTVRTDPDFADALTPEWLERMLQPPTPGTEMSYRCVYLAEVLTYLVRGMASANNVRIGDKTTINLARELVYRGLLDQDMLDRVEYSLDWQEQLMHRMPQGRTASDQAAELESICRELQAVARTPKE